MTARRWAIRLIETGELEDFHYTKDAADSICEDYYHDTGKRHYEVVPVEIRVVEADDDLERAREIALKDSMTLLARLSRRLGGHDGEGIDAFLERTQKKLRVFSPLRAERAAQPATPYTLCEECGNPECQCDGNPVAYALCGEPMPTFVNPLLAAEARASAALDEGDNQTYSEAVPSPVECGCIPDRPDYKLVWSKEHAASCKHAAPAEVPATKCACAAGRNSHLWGDDLDDHHPNCEHHPDYGKRRRRPDREERDA